MHKLQVQLPDELWKRFEKASAPGGSRVAVRAGTAGIIVQALRARGIRTRIVVDADAFEWMRFLRDPANRWELAPYMTPGRALRPGLTLVADTERRLVWVRGGDGRRALGRHAASATPNARMAA